MKNERPFYIICGAAIILIQLFVYLRYVQLNNPSYSIWSLVGWILIGLSIAISAQQNTKWLRVVFSIAALLCMIVAYTQIQ